MRKQLETLALYSSTSRPRIDLGSGLYCRAGSIAIELSITLILTVDTGKFVVEIDLQISALRNFHELRPAPMPH